MTKEFVAQPLASPGSANEIFTWSGSEIIDQYIYLHNKYRVLTDPKRQNIKQMFLNQIKEVKKHCSKAGRKGRRHLIANMS